MIQSRPFVKCKGASAATESVDVQNNSCSRVRDVDWFFLKVVFFFFFFRNQARLADARNDVAFSPWWING